MRQACDRVGQPTDPGNLYLLNNGSPLAASLGVRALRRQLSRIRQSDLADQETNTRSSAPEHGSAQVSARDLAQCTGCRKPHPRAQQRSPHRASAVSRLVKPEASPPLGRDDSERRRSDALCPSTGDTSRLAPGAGCAAGAWHAPANPCHRLSPLWRSSHGPTPG